MFGNDRIQKLERQVKFLKEDVAVLQDYVRQIQGELIDAKVKERLKETSEADKMQKENEILKKKNECIKERIELVKEYEEVKKELQEIQDMFKEAF